MARLYVSNASQRMSVATGVATAVPCTLAVWAYMVSRASATVTDGNYDALTLANTGANDWVRLFFNAGAGQIWASSNGSVAGGGSATLTVSLSRVGAWVPGVAIFTSGSARTVVTQGASATDTTAITYGGAFNNSTVGALFPFFLGAYSNFFDGMIAAPAVWNVSLTLNEALAYCQGVDPILIRRQNLAETWDDMGQARVNRANSMTTIFGNPSATRIVRQLMDADRPTRTYGTRRVLRAS